MQLLTENLPEGLKSVSEVSNAKDIMSEKQLKSLWECFAQDQAFARHIASILESWALLLTQDNRLFSLASSILPVCPINLLSGRVIEKVYQVVKKVNMPLLNTCVVTMVSICPSFTDGKVILSNIYHTHLETPLLSMLSKDDMNIIIDYFVSYLKKEMYDEEVIRANTVSTTV